MRRRAFMAGIGGWASWPWAAHAQRPAMPVVGYLGAESCERMSARVLAFAQGLRKSGFVDGQNVAIAYR